MTLPGFGAPRWKPPLNGLAAGPGEGEQGDRHPKGRWLESEHATHAGDAPIPVAVDQGSGGEPIALTRRGPTKIIAAVLEEAEGGARKTWIIRAANLNHVRGTEYIDRCLDAGLLVEQGGRYFLSEKGERLLGHWNEVAQRLPGD